MTDRCIDKRRWRVLALAHAVGGTLRLGADAAASLRRLEWRLAARQAYELSNRSVFFVAVVMAFTGAIMTVQAMGHAIPVLAAGQEFEPKSAARAG